MAKAKGVNCTSFSLSNKSVSKGSDKETSFASKSVLSKVGGGEKEYPNSNLRI